MSSKDLMRLTEKPETFSAGASLTVSTTDWNQHLLSSLSETLFAATGPTNLALFGQLPGARTAHMFLLERPQTEGAQQITLTTVVKRFVCNVMVSQLPDDAVPELYDTISEMYEHYLRPVSLPMRSAVTTKYTAKRGKINAPPEIRIEE